MEKYYLYIIQSLQDNSYYVGQTENLKIRIKKHNSGMEFYTKRKIPWKLVYTEKYNSRGEAIKREKQIKKKKSKKHIEWLIKK